MIRLDICRVLLLASLLLAPPGGGVAFAAATDASDVTSVCAPAGRDTSITSTDSRVAVRVFPSMPDDVQITLRMALPLAGVPPTTGLRVGGLLFELAARGCDGSPLETLPAEVNLGIRYADLDVSALDEGRLLIALLDPSTGQWVTAPKLAGDPTTNYVSATITAPGLYTVYYQP